MKRSEVYTLAAEAIESGKETFSCNAILHVRGSEEDMELYRRTMGFSDVVFDGIHDPFLSAVHDFCDFDEVDLSDFRVLLLCMMAAVVEDV